MSVRDELAKIIAQQTVAWDDACRIADAILDEGWGSPDDLNTARYDGYDEALTDTANLTRDLGKAMVSLPEEEVSEEDFARVVDVVNGSGITTYWAFQMNVAERIYTTLGERIQDIENPFETDS